MNEKKLSIPSYTFQDTNCLNLFRFCNRNGDWTHYVRQDEKNTEEKIDIFIPAVNHIMHTAYNKGERFTQYLLSVSKEESKEKLESAGSSGTKVHEAISDLIKGHKVTMETKYLNRKTNKQEVLNDREWKCLQVFVDWAKEFKPQTILNERSVYYKDEHAGTLDWFGTIEIQEITGIGKNKVVTPKRIFCLIDWKTSSGIWDEYPMQVSSYRKAGESLNIRHMKDCHTAILRLGTKHKSGFEFKMYSPEETSDNYEKFEIVKKLYNKMIGQFKPVIEEIPMEFEIKIPNFVESKTKKVN